MGAVNRNYILTQGPLSSTVSHFWAMVWEQNSKVIVMLNNIIEKNQVNRFDFSGISFHLIAKLEFYHLGEMPHILAFRINKLSFGM